MKARINMESFAQGVKGSDSKFFEKEAKETVFGAKSGLPEIGRLSIGADMEGRKFPGSIDYFRVRTMNRVIESQMHQKYGNEPKTLPIFFNTNLIENHCIERLELRDNAGKLLAYGDGENFKVWNDTKKGYVSTDIHKRPEIVAQCLEFARTGITSPEKRALIDWKHTLDLRFCIKEVGAMGFWQLSTKAAKTTIPALRGLIDQCFEIFGFFAFMPFYLTVKMVESNTPGITRKYPVVDIIPAFSFEVGAQLSEYIRQNPNFRQSNLALVDLRDKQTVDQIANISSSNFLLSE